MAVGSAMADEEEEVADTSIHYVIPNLEPGDRCQIQPGNRNACVMFIGTVTGMPAGYWVGVQYDERVGKNDGMLNGKRYFTCPPGHGGFLRSTKVNKLDNVQKEIARKKAPRDNSGQIHGVALLNGRARTPRLGITW